MCEIFGAFGWQEGITLMKWLADHMLVRGINTFVPHAFTEKTFPDPDCPPHFYARGYNPQYRYVDKVFNYMNRISHLLSGGRPVIKTGILYHGEMEWMGRAAYFHNIGRELYRKQIDYDVVDLDHLQEAEIGEGKIKVGVLELERLLIPFADRYPKAVKQIVEKCKQAGVTVLQVIDELPEGDRTNHYWKFPWHQNGELLEECQQVKLEDVTKLIRPELVLVDTESEWLRYYHYVMEDGRHAYMLFNESMDSSVTGRVKLPTMGALARYDGVDNVLTKVAYDVDNGMELKLYPGESVVYVTDAEQKNFGETVKEIKNISWQTYDGDVKILASDYRTTEVFEEKAVIPAEKLAAYEEELTDFAGLLRYELTVNAPDGLSALDLGDCKDAAQVWINGQDTGVRIGYPYHFDLSRGSIKGENRICIQVATTLVNMECDFFSRQTVLLPEGLQGPVRYC